MIITKLQGCIHVFDPQAACYRKSSANNLQKALGSAYAHLTRAQILNQIKWQPCESPTCKVRCCKDHTHFIGS